MFECHVRFERIFASKILTWAVAVTLPQSYDSATKRKKVVRKRPKVMSRQPEWESQKPKDCQKVQRDKVGHLRLETSNDEDLGRPKLEDRKMELGQNRN